jgi:Asp-tRNA(Asn)/Glu-tRNA(Gln) amidotransferase A subunit family amidase
VGSSLWTQILRVVLPANLSTAELFMSTLIDRRGFMALCAAAGLPAGLPEHLWVDASLDAPEGARVAVEPITKEQIAAAENVLGLSFRDSDRDLMLRGLQSALANYTRLHAIPLPNGVPPAFHFDPVPVGKTPVGQPHAPPRPPRVLPAVKKPATEPDWAYAGVVTLSRLIHSRQVTSRQLVERCLARIEQYNPVLLAVITPTKDRALEQADRMDAEARAGKFRGPLHGIPYGAKDLFAVPKYPTTWGSPIYKDQVLDVTAAVVEKLEAAGAVLVAKTSLGEFAQDDTWFGGRTKNPWNTTQGSSGSSAGSASGVSAGLYPFAIGTETNGSIVSPSTVCGVSGLRPTFGRVSRYGAMALSWTMDKVGPIARSAEDLALVFAAMHGADPRDPSTREMPFDFDPRTSLAKLRIGVPQNLSTPPDTAAMRAAAASAPAGGGGGGGFGGRGRSPEQAMASYNAVKPVIEALAKAGATIVPATWPADVNPNAMGFLLNVEAAAAFDEITRNNTVDQMVLQDANAWPTTFRAGHLVSAVDYVQANRARSLLIESLDHFFHDIDIYVSTNVNGTSVNLSGHPQVAVPIALSETRNSSISFVAPLYREDLVLRAAHVWQTASDVHRQRPPKFA